MLGQKRDIKVLVSADVNGRFDQILPKVCQLQEKNQFDFMLLLGNVCHPRAAPCISKISRGLASFPLDLFFIDNSEFSPILSKLHASGVQMVQRFRYLGNKGITQVHGLNVAFFNCYNEKMDSQLFELEVESFLSMCRDKDIDILLTNQWSNEVKAISGKTEPKSAQYVSILANQLSPRYHFVAGCDSFYRLSPYRNAKRRITHFINVAPCQEELKDKYLFAVTIKANNIEFASENDPNCLDNPYLKAVGRETEQSGLSVQQRLVKQSEKKDKPIGEVVVFFEGFPEWARKQDISEFLERWGQIQHLDCFKDKKGGRSGTVRYTQQSSTKSCLADSGKHMFHSSRIKFQAKNIQDRQRVQDCWFCKSNADQSLVVWEGKYVYICLEKGPLCRFHIQIIPYNHTESSTRLDPHEMEQLYKIKARLIAHFSEMNYQVLSYERCLPLSQSINHCVVHLLPLKRTESLARKFAQVNKSDGLDFKEWNGERRGSQYFLHLQFDHKNYLKQIRRREKVQADFMRQLLCELLETPKLVSWKMCERKPEQLIAQLADFAQELKRAAITS